MEFIQVKLVDNKPAIEIKGKVSKEEIEEALSRSMKIRRVRGKVWWAKR